MSLIKGEPNPKFIVKKTGFSDETITVAGYTDFDEEYEPEILSHELWQGELVRELKWFRYRATIYFEKVKGQDLIGLAKIFNPKAYDQLLFYPNSVDKPLFFLDITITEDQLKIAYFYLLAQKDFNAKVIGRIPVDFVPLVLADFTMWGNISLIFTDLTMTFDTLT